jgi:fumarylpyruvate hydrolase
MTRHLFELPEAFSIPLEGEEARFPVRRIFCVGRNYAAHAAEMGNEVDREAPFYFTKAPAAAIASGATIPYPPGTADFHHEMELAVLIGAPAFRVAVSKAPEVILGYCAALDMTRRDLQGIAKDKRRPWDIGKDFESSAVFAPASRASDVGALGDLRLRLSVNGTIRQDAALGEMVHSVPEIVADLSNYYHLAPGDVILTGTPAGVGPVVAGDVLDGRIGGLEPIHLTVGPAE